MDLDVCHKLYKQARDWIYDAGKIIRGKINDPLEVNTKSNPNDLVTSMDQEIEKFFVANIKSHYPDHLIISEEGFGDTVDSLAGTVWMIDPIDGTMNFLHQKRNFAISIGIYDDGIGEMGFIYDVMADVLYSAKKGQGAFKNNEKLEALSHDIRMETSIIGMNHHWLRENRLVDETVMHHLVKTIRGTRTYGSAALELAYVAEGVLDGYLSMRLSPWDIAAGNIIVREVGGIITNMEGNNLDLLAKQSIVACNPQLHQPIIRDFLLKAKK